MTAQINNMKVEKDYTRDFELILLEITKRLLESKSVEEYYQSSELPILEYLDPTKSYPYTVNKVGKDFKWRVKEGHDPAFIISLTNVHGKYYVLDFYFVKINAVGDIEQVFSKQKDSKEGVQAIEGPHYLDTLCKVLVDEILPVFKKSDIPMLYFNAYNEDGKGEQRKAIFSKLISKYNIRTLFRVDEDGFEFKLYKNK